MRIKKKGGRMSQKIKRSKLNITQICNTHYQGSIVCFNFNNQKNLHEILITIDNDYGTNIAGKFSLTVFCGSS